MFLHGIKLKQFLSEHTEWHALIEGFCDGFFPFGYRYEPSKELKEAIEGEHHYYRPGIVLGFVAFVLFCIGIYKWVT